MGYLPNPGSKAAADRSGARVGSWAHSIGAPRFRNHQLLGPPAFLMSYYIHTADKHFDRSWGCIACVASIIQTGTQAGKAGHRQDRFARYTPIAASVAADLYACAHLFCSGSAHEIVQDDQTEPKHQHSSCDGDQHSKSSDELE